MTRIRVVPDDLRQAAQDLARIAQHLRSLGREAHQATNAAPSYGGQFGPKARALGMEAEARLVAQSEQILALSEFLINRAEAFDAVDQHMLSTLDKLIGLIEGWLDEANLYLTPMSGLISFPFQLINQHLRLGLLIDDPGETDEDDQEWKPPWWASVVTHLNDGWSWFDSNVGRPLRDAIINAPQVWQENKEAASTIALFYMAQGWFWYDEHVNRFVDDQIFQFFRDVYSQRPIRQEPGMPINGPISVSLETISNLDSSGIPISVVGSNLVDLINIRGGVFVNFSDTLTGGGDSAVAPVKGIIWLPQRYNQAIFQTDDPGLIAHELAHVLQRDMPEFPAGYFPSGVWPFSPLGNGFDPLSKDGFGYPLGDFTLYMEVQANVVQKTIEYDLLNHELANYPIGSPEYLTIQREMGDLADEIATYTGNPIDAACFVVQEYPDTNPYMGEMVREVIEGSRIPPGGWQHWLSEQGFSEEAINHIEDIASNGTPRPININCLLIDNSSPSASPTPLSATPPPTPSPTTTPTPTPTPTPTSSTTPPPTITNPPSATPSPMIEDHPTNTLDTSNHP